MPTDALDVEALYAGATPVSLERLIDPFTEAEEKAAVRAMNRNSSPARMVSGPVSTPRRGRWLRAP